MWDFSECVIVIVIVIRVPPSFPLHSCWAILAPKLVIHSDILQEAFGACGPYAFHATGNLDSPHRVFEFCIPVEDVSFFSTAVVQK